LKQIPQRPADHHPYERIRSCPLSGHRTGVCTVAHNGNPIANFEYFVHAVGDVHKSYALVFQYADNRKKFFDFSFRQRCRRFVEDDDFCISQQSLRNFDDLSLTYGKQSERRKRIKLDSQSVQNALRLPSHRFFVKHAEFSEYFTPQKYIFFDVHIGKSIELLIDKAYSRFFRLFGIRKRNFFAVDIQYTRIFQMDAGEYLHQRRFPGTVFPHKGVNFSGHKGKFGIIKNKSVSEMLFYTLHYDMHLCAPSAVRLKYTSRL